MFSIPSNALKYLHAKELKVKEYLDIHNIHYDQHDKVIDGGKFGKERPDFLFKRKTHCVILEVDENQHSERPCECESIRMVNISQSLGMPAVFIRYNPDNYVKPGKVKKMPNESHEQRMSLLTDILNKYLNEPPSSFLTVTQLFFDGWNGEHQLNTILEFEGDSYKICEGESEDTTITVKYDKTEQASKIYIEGENEETTIIVKSTPKTKIIVKKKEALVSQIERVIPAKSGKPRIIVKKKINIKPANTISVQS